ncbi:MAG TPA: hypothetical protein VK206_05670 [Anaerolineales bacterium]|nr:hypothetical protein [Anaerolineales bacterium]HLO30664.1 hypothetical protein [Anaerolineales bacterium]
MATKSRKPVTKTSQGRLRTKEFFEDERKRAVAGKQLATRRRDLQNSVVRQHSVRKRQIDPITLIWMAVFFFFIDYLAFQKSVPSFIAWLLIVVPLSLVVIAFFLWGRRKQFPWLSFPLDPLFASTIDPEWSNAFHAFIVCLVFLFLIATATTVFLNK